MSPAAARLGRAVRSPWVRGAFLVVAVALAVAYVWREREGIGAAWSRLDAATVLLALVCSLANVALAGASWRAVLADLGSRLPRAAAARVFFVGQLGRYVPGTVFQFVAQAELARDLGVPRRRTASALVVALGVSMTTAALLVVALLPAALAALGPGAQGGWTAWLARLPWLTPLLLVLLSPPVLNPLLRLLLRAARQPPLEHPLTWRGLGASAGWALASWVAVGAQVLVLTRAVGGADLPLPVLTALCLGGYTLAWATGFLVVLAPAGAGAREVVLAAVLAAATGGAAAAVVVLGSRVLLTLADLLLAGAALLLGRRGASAR
ncbi:lysylphosphatidylglycerol synthase domain-containing protein [Kineococcus terrestris]|uniref:lysylphosphatidylglycerol synthase domain-containing protein n=1 Tax=Kineococcus terrestris TaxID=2044856 RepID=UPI0034DABFF8